VGARRRKGRVVNPPGSYCDACGAPHAVPPIELTFARGEQSTRASVSLCAECGLTVVPSPEGMREGIILGARAYRGLDRAGLRATLSEAISAAPKPKPKGSA